MYYIPQVSPVRQALHHTAWVADRSIEFVRGRDRSRPFFLWTSFVKPHPPFALPYPWHTLYRSTDIPLPKRPHGYEALQTWAMRHQNRYKWREGGPDDGLLRTMKAYYYAEISFIDYHTGRLLQALRDAGELTNTLIVYSSDHGECLGDYHSFGKRSFLDLAARVPLLASWPERLPEGEVCPVPASLLDVTPTFLEAAGVAARSSDSTASRRGGCGSAAPPTAWSSGRSSKRSGRRTWPPTRAGSTSTRRRTSASSCSIWRRIPTRRRTWRRSASTAPASSAAGTRRRDVAARSAERTAARERLRSALFDRFRRDGYSVPLDGDQWRLRPLGADPVDPDEDRFGHGPAWGDPYVRIPGYEQPWIPRR